jgi:hypothetical protein
MNTIVSRGALRIRFYSTPIFNSNDNKKYIDCISPKNRSYKNKKNIIKKINKKDVSYTSSNYSELYNFTKTYSSYHHMYSGLPINNNYKSEK